MSDLIKMMTFKKGDGNTYFPKAGETCLFSGPHGDDESGFVYISVEVLWTDETFILTRIPGCWPGVNKWEHIRCKPINAAAAGEGE